MAKLISGPHGIRTLEALAVKGFVFPGHKHAHDHNTICFSGSFLAEMMNDDGTVKRSIVMKPRQHLLIEAGVVHRLTSLEDGTYGECWFSHRDPANGEVVEAWNGWDGAHV